MATMNPITINPSLMSWAREQSGYALQKIAKRLHVKEEKVAAWEKGDLKPTFRQLDLLAHFLHRPLSVFFLPQPPELTPLGAEYRRLPGVVPGQESPELRLVLRQMLTRRENALNLLGELGRTEPEFSLQAHLNEKPIEVGHRLRQAMKISVDVQFGWNNPWKAWNAWRSSIESLGVLVFQIPKVSLEEVRGLVLLRSPLPVVGVNSKEIPESRAYTLVHEVVHLMLAGGKEENSAIKETRSESEWKKVERFVESATSHALIPEDTLKDVLNHLNLSTNDFGIENVRSVARKFKITPLATATRLQESGYMNRNQYEAWIKEWNKYVDKLPKRKKGFATPVQKTLGRAGRPFSQLVLEALSSNRITPVDASRYLDLKYEHFGKLRDVRAPRKV